MTINNWRKLPHGSWISLDDFSRITVNRQNGITAIYKGSELQGREPYVEIIEPFKNSDEAYFYLDKFMRNEHGLL